MPVFRTLHPALALLLAVAFLSPALPTRMAQAQVEVASGFVHDTWGNADGLPVNTVNSIVQGSGGYLWLATFDGLVRFDGDRFTVFNTVNTPGLPSNRIDDLAEDRAGRLWFIASEQVVGFRQAERYVILPDSLLGGDRPQLIHRAPDGTLWLVGGRTIWQITGETLAHVWTSPPASEPHRIRLGADGARWILQGGAGVVRITDRDTLQLSGPVRDAVGLLPDPLHPGTAWITTETGSFQYKDGAFTQVDDPLSIDRVFFRSTDGTMYVGALNGLYRYDEIADRVRPDPIVRGSSEHEWWLLGWDVFEAPSASSWIVGVQHVLYGEQVALTLPEQSSIERALVDDEGNLWIATSRAGLHRLRPSLFTTYGIAEGLPSANVYGVREGAGGALWVATLGGGVARMDTLGSVRSWRRPEVPNIAYDVLPLADGGVLVGGGGLSLARPDARRGAARRFQPYYENTLGIPITTPLVAALHEDTAGCLWVGGREGIYRNCTDQAGTSHLDHFTTADGLPSNFVRTFLPTRDGALWVSTNGGGLAVYRGSEPRDADGNAFEPFGEAEGLPSGLTRGLYEDASGAIWVATEDRGLARIALPDPGDLAAAQVTVFDTENGLFDNAIHAIVEDAAERLWMSTNRGIFWVPRADLESVAQGATERVFSVSYDERAGLREREANGGTQSAAMRARDGRLWFATQAGAVVIDPADVQIDTARVRTHVEAVNDAPTQIDAKQLRLPLGDRDVTVRYTGLHFTRPEALRFRYRLGPDRPWTEAGTRREAIFTTLAPGRYTFEVIASAYPGQWPASGATLALVIPAAFYETSAFRLLALLALGLGFAGLLMARTRRAQQRERELQRQVEVKTFDVRAEQKRTATALAQVEKQAAKLEALDAAKSRFFANISHEFRTPLTLTLGPLEDLGAGTFGALSAGAAEQVHLAHRNAQRLLRLINQLLDLSRLEAGALELHRDAVDLGDLLHGIAEAFELLAARKQIAFTLDLPPDPAYADADADRLDEVFVNLIGNAFKFTPEGGSVTVTVRANGAAWTVEVADTGIGIAPEDLAHVFQRFYQGARGQSASLPGTGVGLALCREIVELHGGQIDAESSAEDDSTGSRFVVTLPCAEAPAVPTAEALAASGDGAAPQHMAHSPTPAHASAPHEGSTDLDTAFDVDRDRTTVLVVDDHADIRAYVRRHLEPTYRVLEAADGREGVTLTRHRLPDLVVSDVMMPDLDGYGLCRALKSDAATAFIPVVLLTGRAAAEDKLAGLHEGADDYLVKPFDVRELRARVDNLITQRHRLREALSTERAGAAPAAPPADVMISAEDAFVAEVAAAVRAHLGDETLTVERLAETVGLSRSQLGRRLKAAGAATPTATIRTIRLAEAARLLATSAGTVSEIAYAVGFGSVAHFSRAFRAEYGVAPSGYAATLA